jgi:hypothetical protein
MTGVLLKNSFPRNSQKKIASGCPTKFHQRALCVMLDRCKLTSRLVSIKKNLDLGKHFDGLAIQLVWFETPLPNGVHRGICY